MLLRFELEVAGVLTSTNLNYTWLTPAGTNWTVFGSPGSGIGSFKSPCGIFVDFKGRMYIADQGNNRIVSIDDMTGTNWATF